MPSLVVRVTALMSLVDQVMLFAYRLFELGFLVLFLVSLGPIRLFLFDVDRDCHSGHLFHLPVSASSLEPLPDGPAHHEAEDSVRQSFLPG